MCGILLIRSGLPVITGTVNCTRASLSVSMFVGGCLKVDGEGGKSTLDAGEFLVNFQ